MASTSTDAYLEQIIANQEDVEATLEEVLAALKTLKAGQQAMQRDINNIESKVKYLKNNPR